MINHSPSCERNKDVIAQQLKQVFASCRHVLEVGSGSGQHVLHFAEQLPSITWQPMDLSDYFTGLYQNLQHSGANIMPPVELNLAHMPWIPDAEFDGLFSANTLHIMSWQHVVDFFERAGKQLKYHGVLCIYGPFKYNGDFTSPSNANFELWLKNRDSLSGVRDFEAIEELAQNNGFKFLADTAMPANNQLLSFSKIKP